MRDPCGRVLLDVSSAGRRAHFSMYQPGDFILMRTDGSKIDSLVEAGERYRYGDTDYTYWTHCALIVSESGDLVEALESGVKRTNIAHYKGKDIRIVNTMASGAQRSLAVAFALRQVGESYGILDFVSLGFQAVLGWNVSFSNHQQMICSELVARATEKYIPAYDMPAEDMMPADLAHYWGVLSGEPPKKPNWFDRLLALLMLPKHMWGK